MSYIKDTQLIFWLIVFVGWSQVSFELVYFPVCVVIAAFFVYVFIPAAIYGPKLIKKRMVKKEGGNDA
ncbi:hypothetical protein U2T78_001988 [Providencia stuartii]|uniref:hypothetical protein n=1 Tax=Providencia TaxID=586 RepID=UPI0005391A5C|nr:MULTISPECIES: hypothetical protein [Providencia]AXO17627.1 hypothetical protein MC79_003040 [Providencia stuartii]EMA3641292.1 hypothetical protein [Providencia stuartii]MBN5559196.1 hypothetical protein [Providencia stuartii]MBQ0456180.1 hypothetical protein [Providencia stuartii]MBW3099714.1 hypothetical protein [Providencia stuartii]